MATTALIRNHIAGMPPGEPFSSASLLVLGTRAAVDQALSRLVKSGELMRVARGVFARPKVNRFVGVVAPSPLSVAEAVAGATGAKIGLHGAEALRRLGLSTQVPSQAVFYTSGPSRRLLLGQMPVVLKHVAARKLALAGRPAGLALAALWYLGKRGVTPEVVARLAERIDPAEREVLCAAKSSMPAWMADAMHRYEQGAAHG